MKRRSVLPLTVTATAVAVAVAGLPSAHAATRKAAPPPGGTALMGTIKSVTSKTLQLAVGPKHSAATVHLTTSTHYVVNGKQTSKEPAWKKGEQVAVMGARTGSGSYTARTVMVGGPPSGTPGAPAAGAPSGGSPPAGGPGGPPNGAPAGRQISGKVVSANANTLVVRTSSGSKVAIRLTSATRYAVNGKPATSRPAIKAGTTVHVMVPKAGAKNAQLVFIGSMPAPPAPPVG